MLLTNNLDEDAFTPSSIKLVIENMLPRAEVFGAGVGFVHYREPTSEMFGCLFGIGLIQS